ncbi:MAG: Chromate resistance protein ChrB [Caulobacteraceae bacterium]
MLLAQFPAAPSSARVALWRRMRAVGAASVLNGAWVLPSTDEHARLFGQLAQTVRAQGGHVTVFTTRTAEGDLTIFERFGADRASEYAELQERCRAFLEEVAKERQAEKFTFAELEELEDDYEKLAVWIGKIRARDFFPGTDFEAAEGALTACKSAREAFAEAVYSREGLDGPDASADSGAS